MSEMFEVAVRNKFRFPYKGVISVEELYDLPLTALDNVFKTLNAEAKKSEEESLLHTKSKADEELALKIDIVKHIVSVKLKEKEDRENARAKKEMKQRLLEIKAKREDAALENMSDEDLNKMLAELG